MRIPILIFTILLSLTAYAQSNIKSDTITVPFKKTTQKLFTISADDLPIEVRETLTKSKYKGWESGAVYRNLSSNHYVVKINGKKKPRYFTFDETGKSIKNP